MPLSEHEQRLLEQMERALAQFGPCEHHRRSFAPVRAALAGADHGVARP